MKLNRIFTGMAGLLLMLGAASCEDEKDLVIYDGNLPIKTDVLYMLGDATPNGWDNGNPTPLIATEADPLVFEWQGELFAGEIKLCLQPGSWDVSFIRPVNGGREIGPNNISDETFDMHAGDPDNKWRVTEAGKYRLSFNLRNWTYSTYYIGGADAPEVVPIEAESMYLVGSATPCGWNIDEPTELVKIDDYHFVYEGVLTAGELKGYTETGDWNAPAIRPLTANVKISPEGIESEDFVYAPAPDNKWVVSQAGTYKLTFDLENWKVACEYLGEAPEEDPDDTLLNAKQIYLIGDATPGGWTWSMAPVMEKKGATTFSWTGFLSMGQIKASLTKEFGPTYRFLRPSSPDVEISSAGVAAPDFIFTNEEEGPDDKWKVVEAGTYTITFDVKAHTIAVTFGEEPAPSVVPIEADNLWIIGDATPTGWDNMNPTQLTRTADYTFVYEGTLTAGEIKACIETGSWFVPFIRPAFADCEISKNGVQSSDFIFQAGDPDYKWKVVDEGTYRLTFDLRNWKISAEYLGAAAVEDPYETLLKAQQVYLIGSATPADWDWGKAPEMEKSGDTFTWTGPLIAGELKAALKKEFTDNNRYLRPSSPDVVINSNGVAAPDFIFTNENEGPDDKWKVTEAGNYTITFDLKKHTISAKFNN